MFKEENMLDFMLEIKYLRKKEFIYRNLLVMIENWYDFFCFVRGDLKWVFLYIVVVWDWLGYKLVEVVVLIGKENYCIFNEYCLVY